MVGGLRAEGNGNRHLRHHRGAAAADQAAVGEQNLAAAARRLDRRIHPGSARSSEDEITALMGQLLDFYPRYAIDHKGAERSVEIVKRLLC
jgi:hypothetical protein